MPKPPRYNTDTNVLSVRVSPKEIDKYFEFEAKPLLGQKELIHFLTRVRNTIEQYEKERAVDKDTIAKMEYRENSKGRPATAHPRDIIRFLPPEEIAAAVDTYTKEKVSQVIRAVAETKKARMKAAAQITAVHFAGAEILETPGIPPDVKAKIKKILESTPTEDDLNTPRLPGDKERVPLNIPEKSHQIETPQQETPAIDNLFDDEEPIDNEEAFDISNLMDEE